MLLKRESTTLILIQQVHKLQNSYFKERLWEAVIDLEKV